MSGSDNVASMLFENVARRVALLQALTEKNTGLDPTGLYERFFALDETSRYSITNSIASVRSDVTRGLLLQILDRDASPLVRHEAAFALGSIGDNSCCKALQRTLIEDKSFLVRHEAAMALGELGTLEDLPILRQGLKDASSEVAISCAVALNRVLERSADPPSVHRIGD